MQMEIIGYSISAEALELQHTCTHTHTHTLVDGCTNVVEIRELLADHFESSVSIILTIQTYIRGKARGGRDRDTEVSVKQQR